jgi:hypothetical protein
MKPLKFVVITLFAACISLVSAKASALKPSLNRAAANAAAASDKLDKAAAVNGFCADLVSNIPELQMQQCRDAGFKPAKLKSSQGRPLIMRDFTPGEHAAVAPQTSNGDANASAKGGLGRAPRILLIGGIHGDEHAAIAVVFQWIERLKDDRQRRMVWRVLPCVNPDGTLAQPSTRTNAHKVDLNRNFPSPDWNAQALTDWRRKTGSDPRRYPGPRAASEPETRWLMQQIKEFKPDAIVSVHAPLNLLDFDGPQPPPDKLGFLRLEPIGVYPGSLGNYAGRHLGMPVFTMELPRATQPPSAAQSERVFTDLQVWVNKNFPDAQERS